MRCAHLRTLFYVYKNVNFCKHLSLINQFLNFTGFMQGERIVTMSIKTQVIKQPNSQFADVNVTLQSGRTKYYRLPTQNADSFAIQYKKQDKNNSTISNVAFFMSILGGVMFTRLFTKNKSKMSQFLVGTVGGVLSAMAANTGCEKYFEVKQNEMIQKYNAKETYIEA